MSFGGSSLDYHATGAVTLRRRGFRLRNLVLKATLRSDGGSRRSAASRRVYRESQTESSSLIAPVKQVVSTVLPAGAFVVVTFGTALYSFVSFLQLERKRIGVNDFLIVKCLMFYMNNECLHLKYDLQFSLPEFMFGNKIAENFWVEILI